MCSRLRLGHVTATKLRSLTLRAQTDSITDSSQEQLQTIQSTRTHPDPKVLTDLRKRKLVKMQKVISYEFSKGLKFAKEFVKEETDLTADMLANGTWTKIKFKPYNFKAMGAPTMSGALHPLNKVRHEFREIFFEMGFEEMPTNRYDNYRIPISYLLTYE